MECGGARKQKRAGGDHRELRLTRDMEIIMRRK